MSKLILTAVAVMGLTGTAQAADPQIIVIALAKVKPGSEAAFKTAAEKILAPTREEEGNDGYLFHQSLESPAEFGFYEHWKSQIAIDEHFATPHMKAFFAEVADLFEPGYPQIKRFHLINQ